MCWSFFLVNLQACNFPANIANFLRAAFYHKTPPVAASEKLISFPGGVIDLSF